MMNPLSKMGRLFFGLSIIVYGLQQLLIQDFRPQIVPNFPSWVHTITLFPLLTGTAMVVLGVLLTGVLGGTDLLRKKIAFGLGFYFGGLLLVSHLPYLLFVYPHKLSHLGSWGDALKGLAFCGGSFVVAGSFQLPGAGRGDASSESERLTTVGRIFFCTTIILFGCNHFAYDLSGMVPSWIGMQNFWSYFAGAALIASGIAIVLKIGLRPVSLLLALMLFLWFVLVHAPNALDHPTAGRGNPVVSAFDAILFCGVALLLAQSGTEKKVSDPKVVWARDYKTRQQSFSFGTGKKPNA